MVAVAAVRHQWCEPHVRTSVFAWTDRGWRGGPLHGSAIDELYIGMFTPEGTLDAVIGRSGNSPTSAWTPWS